MHGTPPPCVYVCFFRRCGVFFQGRSLAKYEVRGTKDEREERREENGISSCGGGFRSWHWSRIGIENGFMRRQPYRGGSVNYRPTPVSNEDFRNPNAERKRC